ncbi:hypothetical protein AB1N83_001746 [Pleurotus pulmonarius]
MSTFKILRGLSLSLSPASPFNNDTQGKSRSVTVSIVNRKVHSPAYPGNLYRFHRVLTRREFSSRQIISTGMSSSKTRHLRTLARPITR